MRNEEILAEYIREMCPDGADIRSEWVLWALDLSAKANRDGTMINPKWLRAECDVWFIGLEPRPTLTPAMFTKA